MSVESCTLRVKLTHLRRTYKMSSIREEAAIKVSHVSKNFKLPHDQQNSIKGRLINFSKQGYEVQHTLKDISFEVKKGEFFGIVGRNGSGKSTLLKLLAGIYTPSSGSIETTGKLTPFIELGVGFNPELSGRDNVFLNGALLGFNRIEMAAMYDEIVKFAELERFMDQKLKNYSSGMQVRLAFSIAIRANTDILVLDEVLAVGDANFQRKCLNYFKKLKSNKKTVVFVSHDMAAVQDFCDKAIIINEGKIQYEGDAAEAAAIYNDINFSVTSNKDNNFATHYGNGSINITSIEIQKNHKKINYIAPKEEFDIFIKLVANKKIDRAIIGVQIQDTSDNVIFSYNNIEDNLEVSLLKDQSMEIRLTLRNILHNGTYTISTAIKSNDKSLVYDQVLRVSKFEVSGWNISTAFVHPDVKVEYVKKD